MATSPPYPTQMRPLVPVVGFRSGLGERHRARLRSRAAAWHRAARVCACPSPDVEQPIQQHEDADYQIKHFFEEARVRRWIRVNDTQEMKLVAVNANFDFLVCHRSRSFLGGMKFAMHATHAERGTPPSTRTGEAHG
jgi:hypothetical protein